MLDHALRLGVLVSGQGTNLQALLDAIAAKKLHAEVAVVISNHPSVVALDRAKKAGVPTQVLQLKNFPTRESYDQALVASLRQHQSELVVLAGFMHIVSKPFLDAFPDRVINVHPALLPDDPAKDEIELPDGTISPVFRGADSVARALEAGVAWTGCTVHRVTADVDRGPVLKRQTVRILPDDTIAALHARIQHEEHRLLPEAIQDRLR